VEQRLGHQGARSPLSPARRSLAFVTVVPLALLAGATATRASVTIDRPGNWTLTRLGFGKLDTHLGGDDRVSLPYRLPAGARQGPDHWYLIHLHFIIIFAPASGPGRAYVIGLTNDHAAAQIQFRQRRPHRHGTPRIAWNSLDLIRGEVKRVTSSRMIEVDFKNYVQLDGVRPGANSLEIVLERFGRLRVASLRVLPDSGIILTGRGPPDLAIRATSPSQEVLTGDTFEVRFVVRNDGGRAARDVGVAVQTPPNGISVVGASTRGLGRVGSSDGTSGGFHLRAERAGDYRLELQAVGGAQFTGTTIGVAVGGAQQSSEWGMLRIGAGSILMLGGAIALFAARRRRAGPERMIGKGDD
jgi:hypothetical protein